MSKLFDISAFWEFRQITRIMVQTSVNLMEFTL